MKKIVLLLVCTVCFLPMTWNAKADDYTRRDVIGGRNWQTGDGSGSKKQFIADVNGDGYDDAVYFFDADGMSGYWYVAISNGKDGFSNGSPWLRDWGSGSTNQFIADVNSDGAADAVAFYSEKDDMGGVWYVALSKGNRFEITNSTNTKNPECWIYGHGYDSNNQFLADVDGDGDADAVVYFDNKGDKKGNWYVAPSYGTTFGTGFNLWIEEHGADSNKQFMGDVNGDGKADAIIYQHGKGNWCVALSGTKVNDEGQTVACFIPTSTDPNKRWTPWVTGHGNGSIYHMIADIDSDGKADAVAYSGKKNWHIAKSNGIDAFEKFDVWPSKNNIDADAVMVGKPLGGGTFSFVEFKNKEFGNWYVSTPYIPVYFEISNAGWGEEVHLHWWGSGNDQYIKAENVNVAHATKVWYKAVVPHIADVGIQACQKQATGAQYYSAELDYDAKESAYTITKNGDNSNCTYAVSNEMITSRKFVYTKTADNTEWYSNRITTDEGYVSYFTTTNPKEYSFFYGNDIYGYGKVGCYATSYDTNNNITKKTNRGKRALAKETKDYIYYAQVTTVQNKTLQNALQNDTYTPQIARPALYEEDYYIRTDGASGGWNDYKQEDKDNKMTYFAPKTGYVDLDRYYWVKWLENINIKGVLANKYNDYLAEVTNQDHDWSLSAETGGANIRFGYNPTTNTLRRTRLAGSTIERFLIVHGKDIYKDSEPTSATTTLDDAITFTDCNNFVYKADIYTLPNKEATVQYMHHNTTEYPRMLVHEKNHAYLGGEGFESADPKEYRHKLRLYYDYKTDRVYSAWIPRDPITNDTEKEVNHYLCTYRSGNGASTELVPLEDNATLKIQDAVFELTIKSEEQLLESGGYFWFSLPFACRIADIRGIIGKYGAVDSDSESIWAIQRYRGDTRTKDGSLADGVTYWRYLKNTATLEANRGYVLQINRKKEYKYPLTVFFPAYDPNKGDKENNEVTLSSQPTVTVPNHGVGAGVADHTNWNLIGSGALREMKANMWGEEEENKAIQHSFYGWYWDNTHTRGVYYLMNADEDKMQSTQSYFVQYGGTIKMRPSLVENQSSQSSVAVRRVPAASSPIYAMRMEISDGEQTDKTYIILDATATDAYDVNLDLGKIVNAGMPQLYTMCANSKLASNNLPIAETQSVAIGVQATTAGEYTFSMPRTATGVTPMLHDKETGAVVNLALDTYHVSLKAGTYETRFVLQMNILGATTAIDETKSAFSVTQMGHELILSGIEGTVDIRLYDMLGREVYHSTNPYAPIPAAQTGVYVLQVDGVVQRIVIR